MKRQLIIFDVDGLMLNTEARWQQAWQIVGMHHGIPNLGSTAFLKVVGRTGKETEDIIAKELNYREDYMEIVNEAREIGMKLIKNKIEVKPGVYALLDYLKRTGVKLAVATATTKDLTYQRLNSKNLLEYFDTIVCGDEVIKKKPNPEIYLKVLAKMHIDSKDALVLEDSYAGVEAAYCAHIDCIMIPDLKAPTNIQKQQTIMILPTLFDVIHVIDEL